MNKHLKILILIIGIIVVGYVSFNYGQKYKKDIVENDYEYIDVLSKMYGTCENDSCYILNIFKENNTYVFTSGIYATDFVNTGNITRSIKIDDKKYYLNVYYPAIHDEMEDTEETNKDYILELVNNEQIKVNNLSYKKINGDIEEFFDNEGFSH